MSVRGPQGATGRSIQSHVVFHGRVQGVGFRASVCLHAEAIGLQGWVRNELDGTVCMVVEGPPGPIDELISRIQASFGVGLSEIDRQDAPALNEFSGFRILRA